MYLYQNVHEYNYPAAVAALWSLVLLSYLSESAGSSEYFASLVFVPILAWLSRPTSALGSPKEGVG